MKSSTYASLVAITFLIHCNAVSKSFQSALHATEKLFEQLKLLNNLSHMTNTESYQI